jgi:hypothetical protein
VDEMLKETLFATVFHAMQVMGVPWGVTMWLMMRTLSRLPSLVNQCSSPNDNSQLAFYTGASYFLVTERR